MPLSHSTRLYLTGVLLAGCLLALLASVDFARSTGVDSSCSTEVARNAPWNAVCFRADVPGHLLHSAPFAVTDPRQPVHALTGLTLTGIYVARLGSDDPLQNHPLGPLMMIEYVFGHLPVAHSSRRYLTVWEDGYQLFGQRSPTFGSGTWLYQSAFSRRRMELAVTTNGPRSWAMRLTGELAHTIRSRPLLPAPALRLYGQGPATPLIVSHPVGFFVLNNMRAAAKVARFDLVLHGSWDRPTVFSPYSDGACGGDRVPSLVATTRTHWSLDFGDCSEVGIMLRPTRAGPLALEVRTYRLEVDANGTAIAAQGRLLRFGGYSWTGNAS